MEYYAVLKRDEVDWRVPTGTFETHFWWKKAARLCPGNATFAKKKTNIHMLT